MISPNSTSHQQNQHNAGDLADRIIDENTIETYLHLSREKNRNILKLILSKYLSYADTAITELQQKITSCDSNSVETLAHTLKSSSAQVGALELSALYEQIESHAHHQRLDKLNVELVAELAQLHNDVSIALEHIVDNSENLINSDRV